MVLSFIIFFLPRSTHFVNRCNCHSLVHNFLTLMTWLCNMFWDVYEKKSPVSSLDRLEFKEAVALIVIVNIVCYHEHLLNWINTVWERSGTWNNCSVLKIAKDEFIMWSLMRLTLITVWNFSMKFQQITALLRLRKSLGYICIFDQYKVINNAKFITFGSSW